MWSCCVESVFHPSESDLWDVKSSTEVSSHWIIPRFTIILIFLVCFCADWDGLSLQFRERGGCHLNSCSLDRYFWEVHKEDSAMKWHTYYWRLTGFLEHAHLSITDANLTARAQCERTFPTSSTVLEIDSITNAIISWQPALHPAACTRNQPLLFCC